MPEGLRWIARVLGVGVLGTWPFERYLPFVSFMDGLGPAWLYDQVLWWWCAVGFVLLFATRFTRTACACIGLSLLIGLLGCRPSLSVAHTYTACLFLQLALSDDSELIRWQLVVVYASAAFNKLNDPHWLSGDYFEAYLGQRHHVDWYLRGAAGLPPKVLGQVFGVVSIGTQILIAGLFAARLPRWGAALGTWFHSMIGAIVGTPFGPFYIALVCSYVAVLQQRRGLVFSEGDTPSETSPASMFSEGDTPSETSPGLPALFAIALLWNPSLLPHWLHQWLFLPFALAFTAYLYLRRR